MFDTEGNPIDFDSLEDDELLIDIEGAEELDAEVGDSLQLFLGPGTFREMTVSAIMDGWFFKSEQYEVVVSMSLDRAQELLGKEGRLSNILVSNLGDQESGVDLTESVVGRHGDLPALVDNGLELYDIKRAGIDFANEWGNLFLSFFTVFGLFSIGVGLLLIFLIFSMLAAERKAELGMSRAIGMKRGHLIRMFLAEGAIYGLGSSVVGVVIGLGLGYILVKATAGRHQRRRHLRIRPERPRSAGERPGLVLPGRGHYAGDRGIRLVADQPNQHCQGDTGHTGAPALHGPPRRRWQGESC